MSPEELNKLLPLTEHMELSLQERSEMIKFVWRAMESIVDKEWGINPVRNKRGEVEVNHLHTADLSLDSDVNPTPKSRTLH